MPPTTRSSTFAQWAIWVRLNRARAAWCRVPVPSPDSVRWLVPVRVASISAHAAMGVLFSAGFALPRATPASPFLPQSTQGVSPILPPPLIAKMWNGGHYPPITDESAISPAPVDNLEAQSPYNLSSFQHPHNVRQFQGVVNTEASTPPSRSSRGSVDSQLQQSPSMHELYANISQTPTQGYLPGHGTTFNALRRPSPCSNVFATNHQPGGHSPSVMAPGQNMRAPRASLEAMQDIILRPQAVNARSPGGSGAPRMWRRGSRPDIPTYNPASENDDKLCHFCDKRPKRRQERDRHEWLHFADFLYCPQPACPWTGNRIDCFQKHLKDFSCDTGEICRIYDIKRLIDLYLQNRITLEQAASYAAWQHHYYIEEQFGQLDLWYGRDILCRYPVRELLVGNSGNPFELMSLHTY
ncbi:hypothetical protein BC834DRAFT_467371 [Gloeopeniophorella convolvens]|nr:hypothetical protein BC834DRAFT_467371 [Gloeopeniophorella convolvens]